MAAVKKKVHRYDEVAEYKRRIGNFLASYSDLLRLLATALVSFTSHKSIQPYFMGLPTTKFAVYLGQVSLAACLQREINK